MNFQRRYIPEPTIKRQKRDFDQANAEAAAILLADPERYPGIMQECARKWSEIPVEPVKVVAVKPRPVQEDLPLLRGCA